MRYIRSNLSGTVWKHLNFLPKFKYNFSPSASVPFSLAYL